MLNDNENESTGYADMITDCSFAAIVVAIVTVVAMIAWTLRTGGIPPWLL